MASKTTNLSLLKPAAGDKFSITGSEGYNNNMDKIDAAIGQLNSDIGNLNKKVTAQGSKTITLGSNAVSKIGLFTVAEIKEILNISNFDKNKFVATIMNGDFLANQFYVTGNYIEK